MRSKVRLAALGSCMAVFGAILVVVLTRQGAQPPVAEAAAREMTIYRSPTCSCCKEYEAYLRQNGYGVRSIEVADTSTKKSELGVPKPAWSCHTGVIGGYVVEGHVPVGIIEQLLEQRPSISGVALPGMPPGAPGMEGAKEGVLHVMSFGGATATLQHFAQF